MAVSQKAYRVDLFSTTLKRLRVTAVRAPEGAFPLTTKLLLLGFGRGYAQPTKARQAITVARTAMSRHLHRRPSAVAPRRAVGAACATVSVAGGLVTMPKQIRYHHRIGRARVALNSQSRSRVSRLSSTCRSVLHLAATDMSKAPAPRRPPRNSLLAFKRRSILRLRKEHLRADCRCSANRSVRIEQSGPHWPMKPAPVQCTALPAGKAGICSEKVDRTSAAAKQFGSSDLTRAATPAT